MAASHTPSDALRLPTGRDCVLRATPTAADTNAYGGVLGGLIVAQVDTAGSIPAAHRIAGQIATIAVKDFVFKQLIFFGDLLGFCADIIKTGRTSIAVAVGVYAQCQCLDAKVTKVTDAVFIYVDTGSARKSRALPVL